MVRHGVEQGSALTRRIALVLILVASFYATAVPLRLEQHGALWFVHVGDRFLRSAHTSKAIDSATPQSTFGYDGQFYFYIAADPAHAHDYMGYGNEGQAGKRYARIVYPMVSRALSGGSVRALPWAMLIVNLLAILGGTWAVALWLTRRGRWPYPAALYGLWPGMVYAVFRDLSEPLSYFLAALAVLVFDRRRVWPAAALLAASLLTRETTIAFALALAFALWRTDRAWRRPALFLLASIGPMVVWRVIVTQWLHETTIEHTGGKKVLLPFYAMWSWHPWDANHSLIYWTVDVPFVLAAIAALYLLWRRRYVVEAVLFLLNVALFVVFIPHVVTIDYGAAGRGAAPALLALLYCVPAVRSRLVLGVGALIFSPIWFFLMAWALGAPPPFDLITL